MFKRNTNSMILSKRWLILLCSACLIFFLFTAYSSSRSNSDLREDPHFLLDDSSNAHRRPTSIADNFPLIVNYVRLFKDPSLPQPLSFLDCLGAYSVALNLKPDLILIHTNNASANPLELCESQLGVKVTWPPVKMVSVKLQRRINYRPIYQIEHEADIRKLRAVEEYGGLVMDFDVYVINGTLLRQLLKQHPCLVCHEVVEIWLNAGFIGCQSPHARYPQLVLEESYRLKFNPNSWLYNSGEEPFSILKRNNGTAFMVDGVCDHGKGEVRVKDWATLPAYHSYFHATEVLWFFHTTFTLQDAWKLETPMGDIFRWLLKGAPPDLAGKRIPPE